MTEKYLYTKKDDGYTRRHLVHRETAHYYIIKHNEISETKIPKKTLTIKHGSFSWTIYHEETPELIEAYKKSVLKYKYLRHLDELKKVDSVEIMEKILSIQLQAGAKK